MSGLVVENQGAFAELRGVRIALRGVFLMNGVAAACWIPLVPYGKLNFGMSDSDAGLALLMSGVGGIIAMPFAAALMLRYGSRMMTGFGGILSFLSLLALVQAPSPVWLGIGMLFYGLARSLQGISANAQAVVVERRGERPVMSSFHAYFSLGCLLGALLISALLKAGFSTPATLEILDVIFLIVDAPMVFHLLGGDGGKGAKGPLFAIPKGAAAWLLGFFCFASYLGEGSVTGWSANFLHFARGWEVSEAGAAFAAFSTTMMLARFTGDACVARLGRVRTLALGSALAAAGVTLAMTVPSGFVGVIGFAILGIGAGNIVPITFTAAGKLPGLPPSVSIPAVATFGNIASLGGPAMIGFLADAFTLPTALLSIALLYALVSLGARAVR